MRNPIYCESSNWINPLEWLPNRFRLTATATPITEVRTGYVFEGGITRSFLVSQIGSIPILSVTPTSTWIVPAAGAVRSVTVVTNLPTCTVYRTNWISSTEFVPGGFRLTAQPNTD